MLHEPPFMHSLMLAVECAGIWSNTVLGTCAYMKRILGLHLAAGYSISCVELVVLPSVGGSQLDPLEVQVGHKIQAETLPAQLPLNWDMDSFLSSNLS